MSAIIELELGSLETNCYIIPAKDNRAVVIDPASAREVLAVLEGKNLTADTILITHGHFDHFSGAAELIRKTGARLMVTEPDKDMLLDARKCWSDFVPDIPFEPLAADLTYHDGESFEVCGIPFRMMSSKGHTAGSGLLFCKPAPDEKEVIFAGDTLFRGSVGRADGYSGSRAEQREALKKIAQIEGDYVVYCGHGPKTTLAFEQRYNPYITGVIR
ncbi:MAG: MBL fold metallo-hydrolase [Oscillospiraceae bacterium]